MKVEFRKKFLKDLSQLPASYRREIEKFVFEDVQSVQSFFDLKKFEQLKGYLSFYKARFGHYRVGVKYEDNILIFERVLHRKEIYRFFH